MIDLSVVTSRRHTAPAIRFRSPLIIPYRSFAGIVVLSFAGGGSGCFKTIDGQPSEQEKGFQLTCEVD